ncbi:hypothetical protein E3C22_13580 [Jiella endophytica]|uniref:Uncharacterized protein n=1 Tax=Jiella endophytica TaxID=2558362 RepID=A0A4Y8RGD1_9HYPH|nr:hypothetical protein [Jiella endophytica]TFF21718.1 hypothetical protein E3C22_13580 [Jiella endophytica]
MGTVLRFLFVLPLAYVAACLTAAFAMLWPFLEISRAAASDPVFIGRAAFYFGAQAIQVGTVAFLPWAGFMVVSEIAGLSSLLLHMLAGLLGGVAILFAAYGPNVPHMSVQTAILVASLTFALVYWILAGHGAGRWRRAERASPAGRAATPPQGGTA